MYILNQISVLMESSELTEEQTNFLLENMNILNALSSDILDKNYQETSDYRLAIKNRPLLPLDRRSLD